MAREAGKGHRNRRQQATDNSRDFETIACEIDRVRRRVEQEIADELGRADRESEARNEPRERSAELGLRILSVSMTEAEYRALAIIRRLSGEPESEAIERMVRTGLEVHLGEERKGLRRFDPGKQDRQYESVRTDGERSSPPARTVSMDIDLTHDELAYVEALATIAGHTPRETVEALVSRAVSDLTERLEWTISRVYEPPSNMTGASRRASIMNINETVHSVSRHSAEASGENG